MATETFTWKPNNDPAATIAFRTKSAKFGDGYEQRAQDGINNRSQSWPLTFTGQKTRIKEIMAFLDRHAGATPFFFGLTHWAIKCSIDAPSINPRPWGAMPTP